jgi:N6-adenosine-specific RNA methylase IME4
MTELLIYDAACRALADCSRVDEVKGIHDKAIAIKAYAKQAENQEMIADAERIIWRAKNRLGELLEQTERNKGGQGTRSDSEQVLTLAEMGVDRKLSSESQRLAALDAAEKERALAGAEPEKALKNLLAKQQRECRHQEIADRAVSKSFDGRRFALIYADPAWRFDTFSEAGKDSTSAENHYPTQSAEEIAGLMIEGRPIADVAAPDAGLFLWCTSSNIVVALAVMTAWGFSYSTHAVWDKERTGTGYVFLNQHELLLYGKRGQFARPAVMLPSVFRFPRGKHSAKPAEIRQALESMYPAFTAEHRLELNARGEVPGWSTWGNES